MLSKRNILIGTALVVALLTVAALGSGRDRSEEPEPTSTETTSTTTTIEGDPPEKNDGPIAVPDAGRLAGAPVPTARRFVDEWVNRTASEEELRRQRPILVGLSIGDFAQLVQVTIDDAIATGSYGPENQGQVEIAEAVEGEEGGPTVLIVTRERGTDSEPYRFVTYLARLEAVDGGGYAMSALEPQ